jgi:hypothetical protein
MTSNKTWAGTAPRDAPLVVSVLAAALAIIGLVAAVHPNVEGYDASIAPARGAPTIGAQSVADFDAIRASSPEELAQLGDADRLFLLDHGTRVQVLEEEHLRTQVRILSGEHTGKTVWVLTAYVDN